MIDWLFYEEAARDMMREAYKWDADPKNITPAQVTGYADDHGLTGKTLATAYGNVKYKFDPKEEVN